MSPSRVSKTKPRVRSARPQPSAIVGSWQLVRLLGEGQWTEVYQARPKANLPNGQLDYAVKILKEEFQDDPLAIRLLQREEFVSRQVRNEHVISVLSAHVERTPRFIVLPCLEGVTVRTALLETRRFNVPHALWIARQVAEALHALHGNSWMHGDVKPDNVFVATSGHATLLDLGCAKKFDGSSTCGDLFAGSPAYAPPEAFNPNVAMRGESDVYSLGIALYEMLTGQLPFEERDGTELAAAHLTKAVPDPRRLVPQLPASVSRLVRRMLAKDPLRRPDAVELTDCLATLEAESFEDRVLA